MGIASPDLSPVPDEPVAVRSGDIIELYDGLVLNDTLTEAVSVRLRSQDYRKFALYLGVVSSGAPTTVQFQVRFHDPHSGRAHVYRQGLYASLYYEDIDTANGLYESFLGDVAGRELSLRVVGSGTTASDTFTVSAAVEFYV